MHEEHNWLILTSLGLHVSKLRHSTHARKYKPLLHCTESLQGYDIETLWTAEFYLGPCSYNRWLCFVVSWFLSIIFL